MKPLPHRYVTRLAGGPAGSATLSIPGAPDLVVDAPADFDGPGDTWSPESLLLGAVEACFLLTLRAVAKASKIEFSALEVAAEGTVDRKDGAVRFTEIVLRPRLTVAAATDKDRAFRALEKSERACLVSASLATPIRLEPELVVG